MGRLFIVIGLVIQLAASFLLAARGFTEGHLKKVYMSQCQWHITLLPGLAATGTLLGVGCLTLAERTRAIALFCLSLVCALAWLPALAKHSLKFVDRVEDPRNDLEIERLNRHGLILLALGFVISALGAVL